MKTDRPHRPLYWQNSKEETGIFIYNYFAPNKTECTYYIASYNVNSQTAKSKVEENKQIDVVK